MSERATHETLANAEAPSGLQRTLQSRQMQMIALGGVIRAGLFVGSGAVIRAAGLGAVISVHAREPALGAFLARDRVLVRVDQSRRDRRVPRGGHRLCSASGASAHGGFLPNGSGPVQSGAVADTVFKFPVDSHGTGRSRSSSTS